MSRLSSLLERAFENKGNKNHYSDGEWSIGFNERTYDTYFQLYYKNVAVIEGNTLDKELKVCNSSVYPLEKLVPEVEKALPEYHFDIHLSLMIPVDFNGRSLYEVENANYVETAEEVRFEDTTDGYGYDVDIYAVAHLSELKDVVIIDEEGTRYSIDETEFGIESNGELKVYSTVLIPLQESPTIVASKYEEAVKHYSVEFGVNVENDFVKAHAEELVYCYENQKGLVDFDFWTQYEELLDEKISFEEYTAIDKTYGGDPQDIEEQDVEIISNLKVTLNDYRALSVPCEKSSSLADKIARAEIQASQQNSSEEKNISVPERDNE